MVRYHGVLAGNARERAEVIPQHEEEPETTEPQMALFEAEGTASLQRGHNEPRTSRTIEGITAWDVLSA